MFSIIYFGRLATKIEIFYGFEVCIIEMCMEIVGCILT